MPHRAKYEDITNRTETHFLKSANARENKITRAVSAGQGSNTKAPKGVNIDISSKKK